MKLFMRIMGLAMALGSLVSMCVTLGHSMTWALFTMFAGLLIFVGSFEDDDIKPRKKRKGKRNRRA